VAQVHPEAGRDVEQRHAAHERLDPHFRAGQPRPTG
jgi:hypothetical protein